MTGKIVYIHGLTPIHVGSGQAVGVIDLPVARERVTNWPYLPGSGIKGVFRDAYSELGSETINRLFGPERVDSDSAAAGQLVFTDGKLLCLPVRSFYGTFCWVTCPAVLGRLRRDHECAGLSAPFPLWSARLKYEDALLCSNSDICSGDSIYLEDLDLHKAAGASADAWAIAIARQAFDSKPEQEQFCRRFAVVSDDLFTTLTETATDVVARIRIQSDVKVVERGGLWYEEAVPAESLFYFPLLAAPRKGSDPQQILDTLSESWIPSAQIGGNSTVGRGIVRLVLGKEL